LLGRSIPYVELVTVNATITTNAIIFVIKSLLNLIIM